MDDTIDLELKHFKSLSDHPEHLDTFFEKAKEAADETDPKCPFLEIGTRTAGTALILLKAIKESRHKKRMLITVDPYCDVHDLEMMKVGGVATIVTERPCGELRNIAITTLSVTPILG